jgi:GTPase
MKRNPENHYGNVEYKLRLIDKDRERIEGLASQMRYRVDEGTNEAIYVLGVRDDGTPEGITRKDYEESMITIKMAASESNYTVSKLSCTQVPGNVDISGPVDMRKDTCVNRYVYEILIREVMKGYVDIQVGIAGNVDAGKSTLLSVLTTGKPDNGKGLARLEVFNFDHEVKSGRTSSISQHILGFNSNGNVVNYNDDTRRTAMGWPDIIRDSTKVISFYDLCGHRKYLKTTIMGLTSSAPDYCIIVVGANMGVSRMTSEHVFLCVTLRIPFVIVVTKVDICTGGVNGNGIHRTSVMKATMSKIKNLIKLPGIRRIPYTVNTLDDAAVCASTLASESVVPIFKVSNVTGLGMNNLKHFLNRSRKRSILSPSKKDVRYHIDRTFSVPGTGLVIGGTLATGSISIGDKLYLGPSSTGEWTTIIVKSIHSKRVSVITVNCGGYVCLGIRKIDKHTIRRGQVIMSSEGCSVRTFEANINVIKTTSTTVRLGYTPIIHTNTVRQSAKLVHIEGDSQVIRTRDSAIVKFSFCRKPESLLVGDIILMAEGNVKVVGTVTGVSSE